MTPEEHKELAEECAQKLFDVADMSDLANVFYDVQYEYADNLSDDDLLELAKNLNIPTEEI